jgi:hypothetical protein
MSVIESTLRTDDPSASENADAQRALAAELRANMDRAALGGPESSRERHVARGKLLPRERVEHLLDEGSPFLEVAPLAAHDLYEGDAPGAGLIAGIGLVEGRHVMVICNDATVKGGTYYPMTVKKHLRAQEIALENRLRSSRSSTRAARSCLCRTRSSPIASTSGASSSTRRGCRRSASRSSPPCSAAARPAAPTCRR